MPHQQIHDHLKDMLQQFVTEFVIDVEERVWERFELVPGGSHHLFETLDETSEVEDVGLIGGLMLLIPMQGTLVELLGAVP